MINHSLNQSHNKRPSSPTTALACTLLCLTTFAGLTAAQQTAPSKPQPSKSQPQPTQQPKPQQPKAQPPKPTPTPPATSAPKPAPAATPPAQKPAAQPTAPARANYNPSPVELSVDPWKLEGVGLTMFLPIDSLAQANAAAGSASVQITPTKDNTWRINIHTPRTSNKDLTAAEVCDNVVDERMRNSGEAWIKNDGSQKPEVVGVRGQIKELRKSIKIGDLQCERVYLVVPGTNANDPNLYHGLTVFKTSPSQFVIFELITTEGVFEKAKNIYEATIATAAFEDPGKLATQRAAGIAAARRVLGNIKPEDFKAIMAKPERWERCYRPAPGGAAADAQELGYRRIVTMTGPRSQMRGGSGSQEGYIVQMDARMLSQGTVIDSSASYFVSSDFNEEFWTIRNAVRKDGKVDTMTERGARGGASMAVQVEGTGMAQRDVRPVFQSDGYISRVEATILPYLLLKAALPMDYGFYTYQSDEWTVCYRRDTLEQPEDKPGLWKLTTKLSDKKPPMVSYYNAKGELMYTEMPDGVVWEPTTLQKISELWKSKNLPMERATR